MIKAIIASLCVILLSPQAWALSISIVPSDWGEFSFKEHIVCTMFANTDESNTDIGKVIGVARKKGKYGLVDNTGKVLIPLEYDDGACPLHSSNAAIFLKKSKWGVLDTNQRVLVPFIFDKRIDDFDGVDKVIIKDDRNGATYSALYDKEGQTLLDYRFGELYFENGELIHFEHYLENENGLEKTNGFMDTKGNVILTGSYQWVKLLDDKAGDERFLVKTDDITQMIDRHKTVLAQGYDNMEPFDEQGISRVYLTPLNARHKVGFVDRNGKLIVRPSSHRYPDWGINYEWQLRTDGNSCTLFLQYYSGGAVNDPKFADKSCTLLATPNQPTSAKVGLWRKLWQQIANLFD